MSAKRIAFFIGILCLFFVAGCGNKTVETAAPVKNVKTVDVIKAPLTVTVDYAGKLKPVQEITLSSKASGKVTAIRKDVGMAVNSGDVLMELDGSDLALAEEKIRIQLGEAKRNLDRQKALLDGAAISQATYDNAKSTYDALNITLQQTQNELANTQLKSPIKGIISAKLVDKGMIVSPAVPAFTVIDSSALMLELFVTDKMLTKVKKDDILKIKVATYENEGFVGIVDIINPAIDGKTGLHSVKIRISNPDGKLKGGILGRVDLVAEQKADCLTIPKEALVVENSVSYVYTVHEDLVKKKAVTTGLADTTKIEITSNLTLGEKVITQGQTFLTDGEMVTPVP